MKAALAMIVAPLAIAGAAWLGKKITDRMKDGKLKRLLTTKWKS